jgi:hypothetical protein
MQPPKYPTSAGVLYSQQESLYSSKKYTKDQQEEQNHNLEVNLGANLWAFMGAILLHSCCNTMASTRSMDHLKAPAQLAGKANLQTLKLNAQ